MEQDNELKRLEIFVENLLTRFAALRVEKAALLQEIRERDDIIDGLRENVSLNVTERSELSLRVGKIVEQIEEWEQGLDDSEFEEVSAAGEKSDQESEDVVEDELSLDEDAGDDESPESKESRTEDGKGQQNLFSMETS